MINIVKACHSRQRQRKPNVAVRALRALMLYVSNIPLDIRVDPYGPKNDSKQSAQIEIELGGAAANGGPVVVANGVRCSVLGVQAKGWQSRLCGYLLRTRGLTPHIIERRGPHGAMSVAFPSGRRGAYNLSLQSLAPPRPTEIGNLPKWPATLQLVITGPTPVSSASRSLHGYVAGLPGYKALAVHPTLTQKPGQFGRIASQYNYVQMNLHEARLIDPTVSDIERLACRVRYLLGESVEFAVTNGMQVGLLWANGRWFTIEPKPITGISDIGSGDAWMAAYLIARRIHKAKPTDACYYALEATESKLRGKPIPAFK